MDGVLLLFVPERDPYRVSFPSHTIPLILMLVEYTQRERRKIWLGDESGKLIQ